MNNLTIADYEVAADIARILGYHSTVDYDYDSCVITVGDKNLDIIFIKKEAADFALAITVEE